MYFIYPKLGKKENKVNTNITNYQLYSNYKIVSSESLRGKQPIADVQV